MEPRENLFFRRVGGLAQSGGGSWPVGWGVWSQIWPHIEKVNMPKLVMPETF